MAIVTNWWHVTTTLGEYSTIFVVVRLEQLKVCCAFFCLTRASSRREHCPLHASENIFMISPKVWVFFSECKIMRKLFWWLLAYLFVDFIVTCWWIRWTVDCHCVNLVRHIYMIACKLNHFIIINLLRANREPIFRMVKPNDDLNSWSWPTIAPSVDRGRCAKSTRAKLVPSHHCGAEHIEFCPRLFCVSIFFLITGRAFHLFFLRHCGIFSAVESWSMDRLDGWKRMSWIFCLVCRHLCVKNGKRNERRCQSNMMKWISFKVDDVSLQMAPAISQTTGARFEQLQIYANDCKLMKISVLRTFFFSLRQFTVDNLNWDV